MKTRIHFSLFSLLLIGILSLSNAGIVSDPNRKAMDAAIAKVKPALVRIHVVTLDYYSGREMKGESSGSGAIISKDGYVITNHHVAGRTVRILCTLSNKEEIPAILVGTDPLADIAVLQLKPAKPTDFPFVSFGDSSKVKVGDAVLAMGSPLALSQSVTKGIVSNTEIVMPKFFWPFEKFTMDGEDVGSIVRWIGHDAQIYGGNSGGPLVDMEGNIIGINEMNMGLSGAIPGNLAKEIAGQIIKNGKVIRAWLGLEVQPMLKSVPDIKGVLVSGILSDSPAQTAGFKSGDILVKLNGLITNVRFDEELPLFNQLVAELPVNQKIDAVVLRENKEVTLSVTPIEREEMRPKTFELKEWGFTGRNISLLAAKEMKLKNREGVIITSIREGGPASEAKPTLNERDIIREVNGTPVKNIQELMAFTEQLVNGKTELVPVIVGFDSKSEKYLTVVKVGIKEIEDPGLEVKKAWLPVSFQVLTRELAEQLGLKETKGVRITQVFPGTSAEKAGLKVGDIITKLDDEEINIAQPEDYEVLPTMIRQYKIGATPQLSILRGKEALTIPVELIRAPKLERELVKFKDENFEFTIRDIAFMDRAKEEVKPEQTGVVVTEVKEGGWAALAQLGVDDVITEVDGQKIATIEDMEKIMKVFAEKKPHRVTFRVLRGIHTLYLEMEPNWDKTK